MHAHVHEPPRTSSSRGGSSIRFILATTLFLLISPIALAATDPAGDDVVQPAGVTTPCHDAAADLVAFDARREGSELVLRVATLGALAAIACAGQPVAPPPAAPATQWADVTITDTTPGNGVRFLTAYATGTPASMQACVSRIPESGPVQVACSATTPDGDHEWRIAASGADWSLVGASVTVKAYAVTTHRVGSPAAPQTITFNDRADAVPATL